MSELEIPESSASATLAEVIRDAMNWRLEDVHTAMPAKVVKYDSAAQTVDVQPLVKRVYSANGVKVAESWPQITSVPVAFPRAGDNWLTFPIAAGDTVLLIFCERDADSWWRQDAESEPNDLRLHALDSAVAIPGVYSSKKALTTSSSAVVLNVASELHLGGLNPSEFVALATKVKTELDSFKADLDALKTLLISHVHPGVTAGAAATGTSPAFAAYTPHTPQAVAASKVKAE